MTNYKRNRFTRGICVSGYTKWTDVNINNISKTDGLKKALLIGYKNMTCL